MRYALLGTVEVYSDHGVAVPVTPARLRALLAVLLVNANKVLSTDRISLHLWGDRAPDRGTHAVHAYMSSLRNALRPNTPLANLRPGYRLDLDPGDSDMHTFRRLAAEGTQAARQGQLADAAALLRKARSLWRDPSLPDFPDTPLMTREAARLVHEDNVVRDLLADVRLAIGDTQGLTPELLLQANDDPGNERAWMRVMMSQYRCGMRAAALSTYLLACGLLADQGISPGPELMRVHRQILDDDPAMAESRSLLSLT
jgi:DNA-binding SARP family transcriptional activator